MPTSTEHPLHAPACRRASLCLHSTPFQALLLCLLILSLNQLFRPCSQTDLRQDSTSCVIWGKRLNLSDHTILPSIVFPLVSIEPSGCELGLKSSLVGHAKLGFRDGQLQVSGISHFRRVIKVILDPSRPTSLPSACPEKSKTIIRLRHCPAQNIPVVSHCT